MGNDFAATATGKIFIGIVISVATGLFGYFGGRLSAPNLPPIASLVPTEATVEAGETIQFSAKQSSDPSKSSLQYIWSIGGYPHEMSSVGYCDVNESKQSAVCMFSAPGTFSVSVEIANSDGKSSVAVSPVNVSLQDGFIGLLLKVNSSQEERNSAYRALLRLVDWRAIQRGVSKPILLYDPDRNEPVFAASVQGESDKSESIIEVDALRGVKLMIPYFGEEINYLLGSLVESHGGSILIMPVGEIDDALDKGLSDSGFRAVGSVNDFKSLLKELE